MELWLPDRKSPDGVIVRMPGHGDKMWRALLTFICCSALVGCATGPEHSRADKKVYPEDTPKRVSLTPAEVKAAITPANAYYLSARDDRQFAKLYDFYFPRNKKDLEASFYRRAFDQTLFGPPPRPGQDRHPAFYFAFHNDPSAFHKFVHNKDRDRAGEFSETWAAETLLLLLRLGDDRFAELLSREDRATREIVGGMIDVQVNWKKHRFPKTRACYSFRYVPPVRSPKH